MMREHVYVILRGCGEYADRAIFVAKVYADQEQAQGVLRVLEEIRERYRLAALLPGKTYQQDWRKVKELAPKAQAEYAALGFGVDTMHDDWTLNDAEFVSC